jgi:poly(A) polymerase
MVDRDILKPVLPEITDGRLPKLRALIAAERQAGIAPDPLRRLAALLPNDTEVAAAVAVRLKLSNKARKRLTCAAAADAGATPEALTYRLGNECAVDRLLLAAHPEDAARIAKWHAPRLPVGGAALMARGLPEGPIIARTLRAIEDRWVAAGFPQGPELEAIVAEALASAR